MKKEDLLTTAREQLCDPSLSLNSLYQEHANWSSLTALMLVSELSVRYGVLIKSESFRRCHTLEALSEEVVQLNQLITEQA